MGGHDVNFVALLPRLYTIPLSVWVHQRTADRGWPSHKLCGPLTSSIHDSSICLGASEENRPWVAMT